MEYTLNCKGRLLDFSTPQVMGILNVTPDSFFADSRKQSEAEIAARTEQIVSEGGTIVDVGACSTRPGSTPVDEAEEMERLRQSVAIVRREAPDVIVSVDTFRPDVARMAVEEFGADIINDVGADGQSSVAYSQQNMFRMVSRLRVPYIYMSRKSTMKEVLMDCAEVLSILRSLGQKDMVVDPGFGFGKTLEQNYAILRDMERMQMLHLPVLVGISRKSMIYRLLNSDPAHALNGTTALNTVALLKGASVLRVHDVREAVECVRIAVELQTVNSK